MQLQKFFQMLRRSWWIILLATLAALVVALGLAYRTTPLYRAQAQFIVSPGPSLLASGDRDLVNGIEALDKRSIVATYAEVMGSQQIQRDTASALKMSPEELAAYEITAVVLPSASILDLTVAGPNPEKAALLANEIGQRAIKYIEDRYLVFNVDMLDPAVPPAAPFQPNPARDASLALILGLAFGVAVAMVREQVVPQPLSVSQFPELPAPIFTRREFRERVEAHLLVDSGEPVSLGIIQFHGLDDLYEIQPDKARHLLLEGAQILKNNLSSQDIVGRWDETSLAVLLPATSEKVAVQRLEYARQELARPMKRTDDDPEAIHLDPHIGVATQRGDQPAAALLEQAQMALAQTFISGPKTLLAADIEPISTAAQNGGHPVKARIEYDHQLDSE